jgi:hypothetical protein
VTLNEARGLRKRKAAESQKAGGKKGSDKTQPESSDDDTDVQSFDEAADATTINRRCSHQRGVQRLLRMRS